MQNSRLTNVVIAGPLEPPAPAAVPVVLCEGRLLREVYRGRGAFLCSINEEILLWKMKILPLKNDDFGATRSQPRITQSRLRWQSVPQMTAWQPRGACR